ncbi:MAG: FecR family protein [Thermoflavifilum sp.]|nr:FecR family protein [Thermoflavifilum sp.]
MEEQERLWVLIAKRLSGEATSEELEELAALLQQHPEAQYVWETLQQAWHPAHEVNERITSGEFFAWHVQRMAESGQLPAELFDTSQPSPEFYPWEMEEMAKKYRRKQRLLIVGIGMLVGILIAGIWFWQRPIMPTQQLGSARQMDTVHTENSLVKVISPKGSRMQLQLPDGSKVWLNAGSELTYRRDFMSGHEREVQLIGEAYFDVVHHDQIPFVIHTHKIDIQVLGTVFDVRAYPDDEAIEAVLIKGAIEVNFRDEPSRHILLKPHQKIIIPNKAADVFKTDSVDIVQSAPYAILPVKPMPHDTLVAEISWVHNTLAFQQESFEELARQMERWYNVQFHFLDAAPRQYRFTGVFTTETLAEALHALQLASTRQPFTYRIVQKDVWISSDTTQMVSP